MRSLKYMSFIAVGLLTVAIGCKDDSLSPYIDPLGNAHGLIQFVSSVDGSISPLLSEFYDQATVDDGSFFDEAASTAAQEINTKLTWFSIDNRVTIASIELYLEYDEAYTDIDRNPLIAHHGGASPKPTVPAGKLWKTITAPGNGVATDIKVTAADVYTLFQGNTFNYGSGAVNIFSANPYNADYDRTDATHRFYGERTYAGPTGNADFAPDTFRINWRLISEDGTAYGSWGSSVCSDLVGANCYGQWGVAQ
jgi:hypothetical protein